MTLKIIAAAAAVVLFTGAAQAATLSIDGTVNLSPQFSARHGNFHPQGLGYDGATNELLYSQQQSRRIDRSDTSGVFTGSTLLTSGGRTHTTSAGADGTNYYYSTYTGNTRGADLYSKNKTTGVETQISVELAAYGGYPIDVRDGKMYRAENTTSYYWGDLSTIRISNLTSVDTFDQIVSLNTTAGIGDFGIDHVNNEAWVLDYNANASIRRFDLSTGALLDVFAVGVDGLDAGLTYANGKVYVYDWVSGSSSTLSTYTVGGVTAPVPLPASLPLLLVGFAGLFGLRKSRRAA